MSRDINKVPAYFPTAVATNRGWEDPKTGELLVANRGLDLDQIEARVEDEPTSNDVDEIISDEPIYDISVDESATTEDIEPVSEDMVDYESFTKAEIVNYAKEHFNTDLNSRNNRNKLLSQIKELVTG